jgi:glucose dehydrogenase
MLTLFLILGMQAPGDWPAYGRDPGGARFSPLTQITRENVATLQVAWTYHTGEPDMASMSHRPPALEVTPLVVDGLMYISTPAGNIIALDPATGAERWRYDAGVNPHRGYSDFAERGHRAPAAFSRPRSTPASSHSTLRRGSRAQDLVRPVSWTYAPGFVSHRSSSCSTK